METNNVILTKKDFISYMVKNVRENLATNSKGTGSIEEVYGFAIGWVFSGCILFIFIVNSIISQGFSLWLLPYILIPLFIISLATWKLFQLRIYKSLGKYFDKKELILQNDILLRKLEGKNRKDITVDPSLIMAFVDTLSEINNAYKDILIPLSVANEGRIYFKEDAQKKLSEFVGREKIWLVEYTRSYRIVLDSWLMNHQKELEQVQQNIEKFSHETQEGVDILRMASTRLDMNIQNLEQVRVRI